MCNFKEDLVAWLDGELSTNEVLAVERHLKVCCECQHLRSSYEDASSSFAAYYFETTRPKPAAASAPVIPRSIPYVAGAAAILAVALALIPRSAEHQRDEVAAASAAQQTIHVPGATDSVAPVHPTRTVAVGHRANHKKAQPPDWATAPPAIQIAIPADAIFPPGAVPEGFIYIASLAPDGSLRDLRIRP